MGGQVSGFTAKTVKTSTGHKIGRITALDPSGRSYNDKPPEERLNPEDAEVVAVIHTDTVKIGFNDSCGTVDLFVNGKVYPQPGCPDDIDLIEFGKCEILKCSQTVIFSFSVLQPLQSLQIFDRSCPEEQTRRDKMCIFPKIQRRSVL